MTATASPGVTAYTRPELSLSIGLAHTRVPHYSIVYILEGNLSQQSRAAIAAESVALLYDSVPR